MFAELALHKKPLKETTVRVSASCAVLIKRLCYISFTEALKFRIYQRTRSQQQRGSFSGYRGEFVKVMHSPVCKTWLTEICFSLIKLDAAINEGCVVLKRCSSEVRDWKRCSLHKSTKITFIVIFKEQRNSSSGRLLSALQDKDTENHSSLQPSGFIIL